MWRCAPCGRGGGFLGENGDRSITVAGCGGGRGRAGASQEQAWPPLWLCWALLGVPRTCPI